MAQLEADIFREKLAKLLESYEATIFIEVHQDYSGVQGVDITFDLGTACGYNLSNSHFPKELDSESIRATIKN